MNGCLCNRFPLFIDHNSGALKVSPKCKDNRKTQMSASFTTLSVTDRIAVSPVSNPWSLDIESNESESVIIAQSDSFNRLLVLCAHQIDTSDCYNVSVDVYTHMGGGKKYSRTVKFTTSRGWVDQWIEMTQQHLPVR